MVNGDRDGNKLKDLYQWTPRLFVLDRLRVRLVDLAASCIRAGRLQVNKEATVIIEKNSGIRGENIHHIRAY